MSHKSMVLQTLYQKASTGKVKRWTVMAVNDEFGRAIVRKIHGQVGGKLQTNDRLIKEGKNLGQANATSAYEQAQLEAQSAWNKQRDKGYTEDPSGESDVLLPMLAMDFHKNKHRVQYPAMVQPKLNGVRCLAKKVDFETIDYMSRGGKSYNGTLAHLTPHLLSAMQVGDVLDGEIYVHEWTFQEIVRAVKKYRPGVSEQLQYWVYDKVADDPFSARCSEVLGLALSRDNFFKVRTAFVTSEAEIKRFHDEFVAAGFEGAIIRNTAAGYQINKRTADLQKYKEFFDKEVTIIGGKEGDGLEAGCVIFHVQDENGNQFWSRPRGSREQRQRWFQNIGALVGKPLTIRYQELSEDGVPVFNVGIAIRDYE